MKSKFTGNAKFTKKLNLQEKAKYKIKSSKGKGKFVKENKMTL